LGQTTQPATPTASTPAPTAGNSQDFFSSSLDRLTRVRCCVAALPDRRGAPALRPPDWCRLLASGELATSFWISSTSAAPVLKRSAACFAISPAISGCNQW